MYKITFYGDRLPETMTTEAGKEFYNDFKNNELPERVEINGKFTIARGKIASVEFVADKAETYQMSKAELVQFQEKLRPYLNESGGLSEDGKLRFLEAENLVRVVRHKAVVMTQSDAAVYINPDMITHYEKLVDKINQWQSATGKRQYAKKMETRDLERTAATL